MRNFYFSKKTNSRIPSHSCPVGAPKSSNSEQTECVMCISVPDSLKHKENKPLNIQKHEDSLNISPAKNPEFLKNF